MIVLITGCAGFIGSHLSEKLLDTGNTVIGIDNFDPFYAKEIKQENLKKIITNPRFHFLEGDIGSYEFWGNVPQKPEIIFHLAAKAGVLPSIKNVEEYIKTNINGTQQVLEYMKNNAVQKLIFASSSSVYGNNKKVPFSETDNVDYAISPYAFTKKSCEILNHTYHYLYKMDIINLRFFTVFGPRQRPDLAIRKFIELIEQDRPIEMYGDGSTSRDYTYIEDIVDGILKAKKYILKNNKVFETINLGNNSPVPLKELITTIYSVMKKKENIIVVDPKPGDVEITFADINKAKEKLNYHPKITLVQGLKKFIEWKQKN